MDIQYYSLSKDNKILGIVSSYNFLKFDTSICLTLFCEMDEGQFVSYNDNYYYDNWLRPIPPNTVTAILVSIQQISEEEYNSLSKILEVQDSIQIQPEEEIIEDIPEESTDEEDLQKAAKIAELRDICNKYILRGFDIVLSDGNTHHFSLSTNDQLNIIFMQNMIMNNENLIPYHADNESYTFFSLDDAKKIISAYNAHKMYHLSYFNCLKNYINSLNNSMEIEAVYYGIEIPVDFQSEVLQYYEQ